MLELEETGCLLEREVIELEERVKAAAEGVKRWREETDFDLNEHKLKNSLKIARMELIQY
jgi:SRSO17 transposase